MKPNMCKIELGEDILVVDLSTLAPSTVLQLGGVELTAQELAGINAKSNSIKCATCGDILTSYYHYHSVYCTCGKCKIDGGGRELIRDCNGPYVELSKFY